MRGHSEVILHNRTLLAETLVVKRREALGNLTSASSTAST